MRFLLVGNYGVGNVGDEALKEYFLTSWNTVDWKVVSAVPEESELPRFPAGIRSFLRFDWLRTAHALKGADGMVFGGGSLFTDVESSYACFLWWAHAFWAWLFRKNILLAFQGVGPWRTFTGRMLTRWVVRRASFISVRDQASFDRLREWRIPNVVRSFDPVFSLVHDAEYDLTSQKTLVVIPRKNSGDDFTAILNALLRSGRWERVCLLSLQPENHQEWNALMQMREGIQQEVQVLSIHSLSKLIEGVAQGSFVLSQRYHGALVALALGRELQVVPQGEDDKLASIQQIIEEIPLHGRKERLRMLVQEGENALGNSLSK